ncbi:hypothetical protein [Bacteroides sp. ET225]|uniref:hypothetical protein n=1 Tax=Bacteroides sp. ET225 TaxID=2972461 RepID=UPI0021ACEDF5|nr:hypothetical protein [Bacteroides sp. ET225]MCR8919201.1 hypothetical protein [Bacteroides sp. ET225]
MKVRTKNGVSTIMKAAAFMAVCCAAAYAAGILESAWAVVPAAAALAAAVCRFLFMERGAFYFVSFIADGRHGRVFLRFGERVSLDEIEKAISRMTSGHEALVIGYRRISRHEYELNMKGEER